MIQPVFRPKQPEYGLYLYLELYCLLYNANAKQILLMFVKDFFLKVAQKKGALNEPTRLRALKQ